VDIDENRLLLGAVCGIDVEIEAVFGAGDLVVRELDGRICRTCAVTDNRYGVCPSLLRDQRTILTVVGTARWLVFSL
jgi:hypothetical protein